MRWYERLCSSQLTWLGCFLCTFHTEKVKLNALQYCMNCYLTCAQEDFAFGQKADRLRHFPETLLGDEWRISHDHVKRMLYQFLRQGERFVVVIEHKPFSVDLKSSVVLKENCFAIGRFDFEQFSVHGRAGEARNTIYGKNN